MFYGFFARPCSFAVPNLAQWIGAIDSLWWKLTFCKDNNNQKKYANFVRYLILYLTNSRFLELFTR